ncbi:MAG: CoA-binding protein [Planctomycetes bacterium]|nr:CoA-binding protein [Planctomycetota bacterium]MBI3848045.1 CoA-binding protein [Planctomycetota bacterium]
MADPVDSTDRNIQRALATGRNVAVVGLSDDPSRPSHDVARYLQRAGFRVIPVNPNLGTVLGERCYENLSAIPIAIDIVDVFRRSEFVAEVVDESIRIGAKAIWLQLGVSDPDSAARARRAGLVVVENRCIKVEHAVRG